MTAPSDQTRRRFLEGLSGTLLAGAACAPKAGPGPAPANAKTIASPAPLAPVSPSDRVQLGAIGMGIMGFNNCRSAVKLPGVELRAVCDLYDGRLKRAREVFGAELQTTREYEKILDDKSIDGVIISTPDHWHARIAVEAMRKGKAVYLEKPMVQRLEEGLDVVRAQAETKRVCQVGSQRVSSTVYNKARELYQSGAIGQLVLAEAFWDRQSAIGAWQYSIPRDASPETLDWQRFLGSTASVPFDPVRFFRWRNYRAYGTGVAGDLFVHLFSGLHLITGSLGPTRIYAAGGLRYWKDGRDVPDVMMGLYDYPETAKHSAFNLQVRVNLIDGGGGRDAIVLVGTEGKLILGDRGLRVVRSALGQAPGYGGWDSFDTFDSAGQAEYVKWYDAEYQGKSNKSDKSEEEYTAAEGYSDHLHHHQNFIAALRGQTNVVEDPSFGFRAAAVALASNQSVFEGKLIHWNPEAMTIA